MLHGKIQDPTALPRLGGQPAFRRSIFAEAKALLQRAALNAAVAARHSDLGRAADSKSGALALEPTAVLSGPCRMTRGRPCNSSLRTTLRYSANALRAEGDVESPGLSTREQVRQRAGKARADGRRCDFRAGRANHSGPPPAFRVRGACWRAGCSARPVRRAGTGNVAMGAKATEQSLDPTANAPVHDSADRTSFHVDLICIMYA